MNAMILPYAHEVPMSHTPWGYDSQPPEYMKTLRKIRVTSVLPLTVFFMVNTLCLWKFIQISMVDGLDLLVFMDDYCISFLLLKARIDYSQILVVASFTT